MRFSCNRVKGAHRVSRLKNGFNATIQKKISHNGSKRKKERFFGWNGIYNTEELHSCVMCLLSVGQFSLEDSFFYELSTVPMLVFTITGEGRFPKNKALSKNKLKIEVPRRNGLIN